MDLLIFDLPNLGLLLSFVGLLLFWSFVAHESIRYAPFENQKSIARKWAYAFAAYMVFIVVVVMLSLNGFFSSTHAVPPRAVFMLGPIFIFIGFLIFTKTTGRFKWITWIRPGVLIWIQSFRIVIEIILYFLHQERLVPVELTFEGQNFDMLVGITALPVGYLFYKRSRLSRTVGIIWNIFGLLALANILRIAILSIPSTFMVYEVNLLPLYFPGILLAAFIMPSAIYIHILSLKQLIWLAKKSA